MQTMHNKGKSQGGISRIKTKMHGRKNFYLPTMLYHCKGVEQKPKLQQLITMWKDYDNDVAHHAYTPPSTYIIKQN